MVVIIIYGRNGQVVIVYGKTLQCGSCMYIFQGVTPCHRPNCGASVM